MNLLTSFDLHSLVIPYFLSVPQASITLIGSFNISLISVYKSSGNGVLSFNACSNIDFKLFKLPSIVYNNKIYVNHILNNLKYDKNIKNI